MEDAWLARGKLAALVWDFLAWQIDRVSLTPTWVAVLRRGIMTHMLAAHNLDDLRAKLEKAARHVREINQISYPGREGPSPQGRPP